MDKCLLQIFISMDFSFVAGDPHIFFGNASVTGIVEILIIIRMFPDIFQRCEDLKGRSRRILPLQCTVKKGTVAVVINQCIPVLLDRIRIKIRFGNHRQYLSGGRLQHHDRTFVVTKCIITYLLQLCVQCQHKAVPLYFGIQLFFPDLIQDGGMTAQQIIIMDRLDTGLTICCITDNMCKQIAVRIASALCPVFCNVCLCQDVAVRRINIASDDLFLVSRLFCIVLVIINIIPQHHIKIDQITCH